MDYNRIYMQLINRAQIELRKKGCDIYFESHHIVPKSLNGTNDKENLVLLTAREHFIAHKLLCEIYPDNNKLKYALWAMINLNNSKQSRVYSISSREYLNARTNYIYLAQQPKSEEHKLNLKKSWTTERKRLESEKKLGKKMIFKNGVSPLLGTKRPIELILSKEMHPMWGKTHSNETKNKISKSLTGYKHSIATKQKMKLAAENKPILECPHCLLQSKSKGNMNRYHFNNCRYKGDI